MQSTIMNAEAKVARVLLADDHAEIMMQTRNVLAGEFEVVGSVANGADLIKAAAQIDPDVVVLDISMPGLDGIEAARRLKDLGCRAKLVFLSVHEDPDLRARRAAIGRRRLRVKARLASDLITAIHEALEDHRFVSPSIGVELGSDKRAGSRHDD